MKINKILNKINEMNDQTRQWAIGDIVQTKVNIAKQNDNLETLTDSLQTYYNDLMSDLKRFDSDRMVGEYSDFDIDYKDELIYLPLKKVIESLKKTNEQLADILNKSLPKIIQDLKYESKSRRYE